MEQGDKILNHFENISGKFNGIYGKQQGSIFHKLLDLLFRSAILKRRMEIMVGLCGDIKDKRILDIGCGPGRYAVELAKRCPKLVLGVDISPQMISLANTMISGAGCADICKFENRDFMEINFQNKFNIVLAAGVFDYIAEPKIFLSRVADVTQERAIFSFPVKYTLLTPARYIWLSLKKCPNFYYTKRGIRRLLDYSGWEIISIHRIGSFLVNGNYIVACKRR